MRIGLVCDEYPPRPHGGIGTVVATLARGLVGSGHAVRVYEGGRNDGRRRDGDVEICTIRRARLGRPGILADRFRLRRVLLRDTAKGEIDLVEAPDFLGPLPFHLGRRLPVLIRLHGSLAAIAAGTGTRPPPLLASLERLTLRRHGDWIGVSAHAVALAARVAGRSPRHDAVIHPPVDVSDVGEAPDADDGAPLPHRFVLHVGTVSAAKGVVALASAARESLPRHPGVDLVLAGRVADDAGDTRGAVLRALGPDLAARCRFIGHQPRPRMLALIRRATIVASASPFETFGLGLAEAMALGRPVVAPDAPPFREWIEPGRTGLLAGPEPRPLAAALDRLLSDDGLRGRLGEAAQAWARRELAPETFLRRTIGIYEDRLSVVTAGARGARSHAP